MLATWRCFPSEHSRLQSPWHRESVSSSRTSGKSAISMGFDSGERRRINHVPIDFLKWIVRPHRGLDSLLIAGLATSDVTISHTACRGQDGFCFSRDVASFPTSNSDGIVVARGFHASLPAHHFVIQNSELEAFSVRPSSRREAARDLQPGDDLASPKTIRASNASTPSRSRVFSCSARTNGQPPTFSAF